MSDMYTFHGLMSVRDIAGNTLTELGDLNERCVVVNADLAKSSRTQGFIERYPNRSFNVGISEQSMVSFAAGLAAEGYIPYVCSFGPFISLRACEQVRTDVCYNGLPVRFLANNAGYSAGVMGATHCSLEDSAIMCSLGNMAVVEPGDPFQVAKILKASLTWDGPLYIRLGRESQATIYQDNYEYEIGKAIIAREGGDGAFICSGICVHMAIEAAERLHQDTGANIQVVDMHTIKPLDRQAVLNAAKTGRLVAAQDHNIIGGLGYQVAAVLEEAGITCKFKMLGCPDHFVPIATTEYLYKTNGYDSDGLYSNMKRLL